MLNVGPKFAYVAATGDPMGSDPPVFDDMVEGGWRMRFVMPEGSTRDTLPEPSEAIELVQIPGRGRRSPCRA